MATGGSTVNPGAIIGLAFDTTLGVVTGLPATVLMTCTVTAGGAAKLFAAQKAAEYGVSELNEIDSSRAVAPGVEPKLNSSANGANNERRGQGLFVAKTYMAKMQGGIRARNTTEGVMFELRLPCA